LKENYDVWILTRPSYKNINYSEKAQWVLNHLGYDVQEKTIMCGDKSLLKGDYLIDDEGNADKIDLRENGCTLVKAINIQIGNQ
jgi:5'(3')-deoxyribonucleotidase